MAAPPIHANPPRRRSLRYRRARRGEVFRHGFTFTLGGGAYIAVALFVGLAATNSQINLLFLVFGIVLGGLLVSGVLATLTLTGLRATRELPVSATAGQIVMLAYTVRNRKRWLSSYSLHVREYRPPAGCSETYLPAVPPDGAASQRAMILCRRRGLYRFEGLTVYTRFPFSLFLHYARFKNPDELVVFPAIGRLTHDAISLVLRNRGATRQPLARRGGEDEFYGLREYRHGDNPRWIHWRRSARAGVLVVREMSPPTPRRMMVVISARAVELPEPVVPASAPGGRTEERADDVLEQALSLAASLIHDAVRQGFEVGLILASSEDEGRARWIPASRGQRHWFGMMRALATFQGREALALGALPRESLRQMAGAHCLWITRGLGAAEVQRQAGALAEWNIAVSPLRAEETRFERLMVLPPPELELAAKIPHASVPAQAR